MLSLLPAISAGQEIDPSVFSTTIVPVVGTIRGAGQVRWRADVRIVNSGSEPVEAILMLPTISEQPWMMTTIEAGGVVVFSDIASEAFGLEDALSPLYVHSLGAKPLTVATMITGEGPDGTVRPQYAGANYRGSFPPRFTFTRLAYSDEYRTNIGLVNLEDRPVTVTMALQRVSGRNIATVTRVLAPTSLIHVPLQDLFPIVTKGRDLVMIAEFGSARAYGYASVLRNDDHSGIFISP